MLCLTILLSSCCPGWHVLAKMTAHAFARKFEGEGERERERERVGGRGREVWEQSLAKLLVSSGSH